MADNTSKTGALLTWAGGIAATVIASVMIYHFTNPPVIPTVQVGIDGFVADAISQKPITNAIVNANLGSTFASQPTDNEGRYSFIINTTTPAPGGSINVDVLAGGYAHYTAAVPIAAAGDTFAELSIVPTAAQIPVAAPPAQPAPGNPAAVGAPLQTQPQPVPVPRLIFRAPRNYMKRIDTAALKAK
jgi:hypothetical protein